MIKQCGICGAFFTTTYSEKYCCEECRKEAKRRQKLEYRNKTKVNAYERVCAYCGETFYTFLSRKKFCSDDCQRAYLRGESNAIFERKDYRRTKEYREWWRAYNRSPDDPMKLDRKLEDLKEKGISYADYQKQQTLERYGRIK